MWLAKILLTIAKGMTRTTVKLTCPQLKTEANFSARKHC